MKLQPMREKDIETVAGWISRKANYRWLDFGAGKQFLKKPELEAMFKSEKHDFRLFSPDREEDETIGMVVLSNISFNLHTATLWFVLGNKKYRGQGYSTRAVHKMLTHAFMELNLKSVYSWAAENNTPAIKILMRNNFRLIGKRRKCHHVNGKTCDRWLFDLLASEHNNNLKLESSRKISESIFYEVQADGVKEATEHVNSEQIGTR